MNSRVLVVSPYFPPANGADAHRVRTTLPFFHEFGWQADVLAVDPECLAVPHDAWLLAGIPAQVSITRSSALSLKWSKIPGLGTLDYRAYTRVRETGNRLLAENPYQLIYFSTTVFALTALGPYWKKRFGVPYVVDYQDPWFTDYYRKQRIRPPGGHLKYWVSDRIARWQEPRVIRDCTGLTAVSEEFPNELDARYPAVSKLPRFVAPFPGASRDFRRVKETQQQQDIFDPGDGRVHWVYVGASGAFMRKPLAALFQALAQARKAAQPNWIESLRLHFIGTSYAPRGTGEPSVLPIAEPFGVADLVEEQTDRIAYSTMLACLLQAHALLVPGADSPAYAASKLIPYLMAKRPTLAILRSDCTAADTARELAGATLVTYAEGESETQISQRISEMWFRQGKCDVVVALREEHLERFTDRGQAKLLCEFFDSLVRQVAAQR